MDIRNYPELIEKINEIVNANGTAEIKLESRGTRVSVVEVRRTLKMAIKTSSGEVISER